MTISLFVCLLAGFNKYYWLDLPEKNRRRVLVQLRSHYILKLIWITVWVQKK